MEYKNSKGRENENKKNKTIKKRDIIIYCFYIIYYIILTNFIVSVSTDESEGPKYYNITLKINKTGNINIFCSQSNLSYCPQLHFPDMIEINGINQSNVQSYYNFNRTENIVKLIWKNYVDETSCLFYRCFDIIKIDLSQFDLSKVKSMD